MTEPLIEHEIEDLRGLIADLYRRLAHEEPGRAEALARELAALFATSAQEFSRLAGETRQKDA
jgi:hypothetical protein